MKTLVVHYSSETNLDLSYQYGWVYSLRKNNLFKCDFLNLNNFHPIYKTKLKISDIKKIFLKKYDCIIILHSAFSNTCHVPHYLQKILELKKSFKVYFIGNEYKHMPEKMKFTKQINANLFITQTHLPQVIKLYKDHLKINVSYINSGGLDEEVFYPKINFDDRKILIGYRSYLEPEYFGHQDRLDLYNFLKKFSVRSTLNYDLSVRAEDRFAYIDWSNFLNKCKCLVSSNTGYSYFSLNDDLRNKVNNSNLKNFSEIYDKFFKNSPKGVEWRALTGKSIEAAGCKTAQILVEGDYGEHFKPNVHYIPLKKDFSNFEECIEKLNNKNIVNSIIENSYTIVKENYLYEHHIKKLYNEIIKKI